MENRVSIKFKDVESGASGECVTREAETFISLLRGMLPGGVRKSEAPQKAGPITGPAKITGDAERDVVAIYDDFGIPSIMHRFRGVTDKELFGGSGKVHPAFIVNGKALDEIFISAYENCEIDGRPYSLPFQRAWVDVTNGEFAKACFSKGKGWHMMTRPEWGLLALTSLKNGTLPHGNTSRGKYRADETEKGVVYDDVFTLTGAGPATWAHNHKPTGVHDLCGNHWEMVRGVRLKDGKLQAARNNDAATDIDLAEDGAGWADILDNSGQPIYVHAIVNSRETRIVFDTSPCRNDESSVGLRWKNVEINCESDQLKELALFAGEDEAYMWADATQGEWIMFRGGSWNNGAYAGVFYSNLNNARSNSNTYIGGRSAFYNAD